MPWPSPAEVLPHKPPMVLLDEVLDASGDTVVCGLSVRGDTPFADSTGLPAIVLLELMAQCVGVYAGLRDHARGAPPQIGFLIAVRDLTLAVASVPKGSRLVVRSTHVFGSDELGSFETTVASGAQRIASAILNVYRGDLPARS